MIKEVDISVPIEKYLEKLGYKVRSEVKGCDITAIKDDNLIVVECKTSVSLKLIYQCVDRQEFCDSVYLAIPILDGKRIPNRKYLLKLLKRLELGLITVTFLKKRCRVDVILEPKEFSRKRKLKYRSSIIGEINGRSGNYNRGGSVGVKLMTAYKESSIKIAKLLIKEGPKTSSQLIKLGTSPKTYSILYKNYYGWFVKSEARGVYDISSKGRLTLEEYESYLT